jgi:prepilin-type N-terminal cleavage/methylation domain-containing protein
MRRAQRGFTLIELVLVVAIFLVVTVIGFGMTRDTMPRYRAKKGALQFAGHVSMCRMLAIETNLECRILMADFDASPGNLSAGEKGKYFIQIGNKDLNADEFDTLPTDDINEKGTWDIGTGSTDKLRRVSIMEYETISGPSSAGSNSIVFSPRGFLTNPAGDFNDGYITISFVNKVAYSKGISDIFRVHIGRTGMTRIENPLMNDPYASSSPGTGATSSGE